MTSEADKNPDPTGTSRSTAHSTSTRLGTSPIRTPLEELDAVFERKIRTFTNLGEDAKVALFRRAHELARAELSAHLNEDG